MNLLKKLKVVKHAEMVETIAICSVACIIDSIAVTTRVPEMSAACTPGCESRPAPAPDAEAAFGLGAEKSSADSVSANASPYCAVERKTKRKTTGK